MTEPRALPISVVIVDDHAMFRSGVRGELTAIGAGVVDVKAEAADVDEAVAAVAQHQPDVVLLDLHLPDTQGDEVLRQLQSDPLTSHIPVVMISADATPNQVSRLLHAGARHYITKPLPIKQLVHVLEELLQEKK